MASKHQFFQLFLSRILREKKEALNAFRVLQGIGGALPPMAFAIIFRIFQPTERGQANALSPVSSMFAEQRWGDLNINRPEKTLAMREEIEQTIYQGQDARLHAWIPLDWARVHLMLGRIEQAYKRLKSFQTCLCYEIPTRYKTDFQVSR